MNTAASIKNLMEKLVRADISRIRCLLGFDGFVDEIVHVVKKRIDADTYLREETLKDYGERIAKTSGLSSNVEIVTVSRKIGGNGPIMANALCELGASVSYIGALGYPEIHPVFSGFAGKCAQVYSIANPASTDAVEFSDGKIIRCKLSALNDVNYPNIRERAGEERLAAIMASSDFIGFVNWSLLNHASSAYAGILENIVARIPKDGPRKTMFFDLADPYARTQEDLLGVLSLIGKFSERFDTVLGINLREAIQVCGLFGKGGSPSEYNLKDLCKTILNFVGVSRVVIHPTDQSCCMGTDGAYDHTYGPYCKKPALTTGAGDNFNAGYMLGGALGFAPGECLLLGMAASGYYVRNAKSANREELISFLNAWSEGKL